nr:hypothetical protein [Tanacetum cinerariifolium]
SVKGGFKPVVEGHNGVEDITMDTAKDIPNGITTNNLSRQTSRQSVKADAAQPPMSTMASPIAEGAEVDAVASIPVFVPGAKPMHGQNT